MNETTCCTTRKTYKEKLRPTPTQERALEEALWQCRALYNTALEQRITAWERCRVSVSRFDQEAELKAIRTAFPEYAAIHAHMLQDVLTRLDRTYQAFFRRVQRGYARQGRAGPLQDRAHRRALVASFERYAQDRYHQHGGGWLVCGDLLC
jgi:transposase